VPGPEITSSSPLLPSDAPLPAVPVVVAPAVGSVNLLDWDDHSVPLHTNTNNHHAPAFAPPPLSFLDFVQDKMNPAVFQSHWTTLPDGFTGRLCLLSHMPSQSSEFDNLFGQQKIFVLASGALPPPSPGYKFFIYAHQSVPKSASNGLDDFLLGDSSAAGGHEEGCFLAQVMIFTTTQEVQVTVKATANLQSTQSNPALVHKFFLDKIVESLHPLHPQIV